MTPAGLGLVRIGMSVAELEAIPVVFETDGAVVTSIRAGRLPHVAYSEGCE